MSEVIFACVHNAGRSQMAAAWFGALADPARAHAVSAGTEPGARVHPEVVEVMREVGIDLAGVTPRRLTDELASGASLLVTMGCGEACPYVPGLRRQDWPLEDPKGKPLERVRAIRDEVKARVQALLVLEGWGRTGVTLGAATADHLGAVGRLLAGAGLPEAGIFDRFPTGYVVARSGGEIVGVAGLETYGGAGLLRSVAVAPSRRGQGIGRALVLDRLDAARTQGLDTVYLLTTDAAGWFAGLGFAPTPREAAPPAVAASPQMTGGSCASAAFLALRL